MNEQLVIQHSAEEDRVALRADGRTVEIHVERTAGRGLSGNIYKARVGRVLPGMNAAFVDIGLDRMAFLHASDVWLPEMGALGEGVPDSTQGEPAERTLVEEADAVGMDGDDQGVEGAPPKQRAQLPIQRLLHQGQEVLVQVVREPVGKKGPRVTMHLTLPGRNVVFLPTIPHIGVSRRIRDPGERERLRKVALDLCPRGSGLIVRTVGEDATEDELRADVAFLVDLWSDVRARDDAASAPSYLYRDLDLVLRALRDLVGPNTSEIIIDDPAELGRIEAFLDRFHSAKWPGGRPIVKAEAGPLPAFERFGISADVSRALSPRVDLPAGGHIVIERTEALTVVDVNTGRFVGSQNLEETLLKVNLEAATEIARQIRLRNLGGIIVVDFIDLEHAADRDTVQTAFEEALKGDRARTKVLKMSAFGLVELTRKRSRESLYERLTETCPTCDGRAFVRSALDVALETLGRLRRQLWKGAGEGGVLTINAPPRVAAILSREIWPAVQAAALEVGVDVVVRDRPFLPPEHVELQYTSAGKKT